MGNFVEKLPSYFAIIKRDSSLTRDYIYTRIEVQVTSCRTRTLSSSSLIRNYERRSLRDSVTVLSMSERVSRRHRDSERKERPMRFGIMPNVDIKRDDHTIKTQCSIFRHILTAAVTLSHVRAGFLLDEIDRSSIFNY